MCIVDVQDWPKGHEDIEAVPLYVEKCNGAVGMPGLVWHGPCSETSTQVSESNDCTLEAGNGLIAAT